MLVDHGRLRVFGSSALRSFWSANDAAKAGAPSRRDDDLLVADDIFGGLFALNGGGFGQDDLGRIFHLAADETKWSLMEVGYMDLIRWCLTGDLALIDEELWDDELPGIERGIDVDKVYSFYPFL